MFPIFSPKKRHNYPPEHFHERLRYLISRDLSEIVMVLMSSRFQQLYLSAIRYSLNSEMVKMFSNLCGFQMEGRVSFGTLIRFIQYIFNTRYQKMLSDRHFIQPDASEEGKEKREVVKSDEAVSFFQLFRFAEGTDYLLIMLGIIFALVSGCSFPWFAYLWGKILDSFLLAEDPQGRLDSAIHYRNIFFYVGLGSLVSSWIAFASWTILSERMAVRCRKAYMKSLLRQDVGWYDIQNQYELSSNFNTDALAYQKATGEKIGSMFNLFAMFVCGAIISLLVGWKMALVILATLPIVGAFIVIFIYLVERRNSTFQESYERADNRSHQALSAIKTVKSLNGEPFEEDIYSTLLEDLKEKVPKWALYAGIGTGLFFFIQYCAFSFGFWYGTHCVAGSYRCRPDSEGQPYTPGEATIVFFAIFVGSFNFMQLVPNIMAILEGMKAASRMYKIIDQEPTIDSKTSSSKGIKKNKIEGFIKFENVSFAYPKNKDITILNNLTLECFAGKDTAFVGDSGCGKSTIVQLVMRFYDPDQGKITLDGVDIKDYDLHWLRGQIGYVGQEPSLFEGTVFENVRIGKSNATQQEVTEALAQAEAIDFVNQLPGKLNYNVGYAGSHLSGGQKQRIAIARALVQKPQIIVLDEATSALDRRNERLIQSTLDRVSKGITTLIVAHRVKTIMNADLIYVLKPGAICEKGKFKQLKRFKDLEVNVDEQDMSKDKKIIDEHAKKAELSNQMAQEKEQDEVYHQYEGPVMTRLFEYTSCCRGYFYIAVICAIIAGAAHPGAALLLANILFRQFQIYPYSKVNSEDSIVENGVWDAQRYVLGVFLLAIFIFLPFMIQSTLFTRVGEDITERIRKEVYHKLLRMQVSWFDRKRNRGGQAATRFGVDSRQVNSLLSSLVSTILMNFSTIITGMVFAFIFEWRIGFVGLIAMPCMVASGFISMLFYGGFGDENKQYYEDSAKMSEEAILNIRTVYSCGYQDRLGELYDEKLKNPLDASIWKGTKLGLLYGLSQLILMFTFGVLFYFGALIMRDNPDVNLLNIFYSIMSITWAGWYAGNNFYFMPDVLSGRQSAKNLFHVIDEEDEEQKQVRLQSKLLKSPIQGDIDIRNISFSYNPNDENIINGISLRIHKGQKVAFVGPSGSGKSTIFQLLQRFYDFEGEIYIDGVEIRDYDIHHLRSHFVAVNQEPSLFTGSIASNIRYNLQAEEAELVEAATNAESIQFIRSKEGGFDADVGVMGSQLSGGQKQRVSMARAMIRKPQILILDEATSALDRMTEKKMQQNADSLMKGKTSLVIAHRIETIVNSDRIYVFDKGDILEQGSYQELNKLKKHFYNLQRGEKMQNDEK